MSILLWLAATASTPVPTGDAQSAAANADGDRIVCKSERFVGSHLSQRVCKPKRDWENGKRNAQDALHKMRLVKPPEKGGN